MASGATPHLDLQRLRSYAASLDAALRVALQGVEHEVSRTAGPYSVAYGLAKIALEHGFSVVRLFHDDNAVSASALVRLQYEAVLRACWAKWAANESWVCRSLDVIERKSDEELGFPPVQNMIEALTASKRTPLELAPSLADFKSRAWEDLNSFSHGGYKSIVRALYGHEVELSMWMLKSSCTLSYVAAMTCAVVSGKQSRVDAVYAARSSHSICFHPTPMPNST